MKRQFGFRCLLGRKCLLSLYSLWLVTGAGGGRGRGCSAGDIPTNISDTQTTSLLWSINQAAECVKVRPSVEILDYVNCKKVLP